jgi:hypothetical protein
MREGGHWPWLGVPLGCWVMKLVTSSLEHTFLGRQTTISIILRNDSTKQLISIVSDDGIRRAGADLALASWHPHHLKAGRAT